MARLDDDEEVGHSEAHGAGPTSTRSASIRRIVVEVVLIAVGVFLGLMAEQWRQHQEHNDLAAATLRRFRGEFQANRDAVAAVKDVHIADLKALQDYLNGNATPRKNGASPFSGTHPAFFEYGAWDLALATQSLSYLDPGLATSVAKVYAMQRQLDDATRDITQVMYSHAGGQDPRAFLTPFAVYFGDCTLLEPRLLAAYDEILPRLDRALGSGKPSAGNGSAPKPLTQ